MAATRTPRTLAEIRRSALDDLVRANDRTRAIARLLRRTSFRFTEGGEAAWSAHFGKPGRLPKRELNSDDWRTILLTAEATADLLNGIAEMARDALGMESP